MVSQIVTTATEDRGTTAAAQRLLQYLHHFLLWDRSSGTAQVRTPAEVADLILLGSFAHNTRKAQSEQLMGEVYKLLRYSLHIITSRELYSKVVGIGDVVNLMEFALKWQAVADLTSQLNWTIIDVREGGAVQPLGADSKRYTEQEWVAYQNPLFEGMMVGSVLYPEVPYRLGLDGIPLIPQYDSDTELYDISERPPTYRYRVALPGQGFTDHYLRLIKDINAKRLRDGEPLIKIPLSQCWISFEQVELLQGLLSIARFANSIAADSGRPTLPWSELDQWDETSKLWVPVTIQ